MVVNLSVGHLRRLWYANRPTHLPLGLGGICWHNFEHNERQIDVGIIEHKNKKH